MKKQLLRNIRRLILLYQETGRDELLVTTEELLEVAEAVVEAAPKIAIGQDPISIPTVWADPADFGNNTPGTSYTLTRDGLEFVDGDSTASTETLSCCGHGCCSEPDHD